MLKRIVLLIYVVGLGVGTFALLPLIHAKEGSTSPTLPNWTTPINVSKNDGNSNYPSIAATEDGQVHIVWSEDTKIMHTYWDGKRWVGPNQAGVGFISSRALAVDSQNHVHLAFMQSGEGAPRHKEFDGMSWSPPTFISSTMSGSTSIPIIRMAANDAKYVVWTNTNNNQYSSFIAQSTENNVWSEPTEVVRDVYGTGFDISPAGHLHFVWRSRLDNLFYYQYGGTTPIAIDTYAGGGISIGVDANERVHLLWSRQYAPHVYHTIIADGQQVPQPCCPKQEITDKLPLGARNFVLTRGPAGKMHMAFYAMDEIYYKVWDEQWTGSFSFLSKNNVRAAFPSIAVDSSERIFTAWRENDIATGSMDIYFTTAPWDLGALPITGSVVTTDGTPIPDVTLAVAPSIRTKTISDGTYLLNGLTPGYTYTIKPSLDGYVFYPEQRAVSAINGSFPDADFIGVPTAYAKPDPFMTLPFTYTEPFTIAASGNVKNRPGRVNSWFDHDLPSNELNQNFTRWDGSITTTTVSDGLYAVKCTTGISCYDGHDGIDFRHPEPNNGNRQPFTLTAVASGTVVNAYYDSTLGNNIIIYHDNGHFTRYSHLASMQVTNSMTVTQSQPIGVMGKTGTGAKSEHLHLVVYRDDGDGIWNGESIDKPVDPYGWSGIDVDPTILAAYPPNYYLWEERIAVDESFSGDIGTQIRYINGRITVDVPAEKFSGPTIIGVAPAIVDALPPENVLSVGPSIKLTLNEGKFPSPEDAITLTFAYEDPDLIHLDESQLNVQQWNETNQSWQPISSTIDTENQEVVGLTNNLGQFELHAPLLCPADTVEPDDSMDRANTIVIDGEPTSKLLDIEDDEDWFIFEAVTDNTYTIETSNLALGVDTTLELYDDDGTLLASSDNAQLASLIQWQAPQAGAYYIRASKTTTSATGCDATYEINVSTTIAEPEIPFSPEADWTLTGPSYNYYGHDIAGLGDINGDGFDDFGHVRGINLWLDIYCGSTQGLPTDSCWSIPIPSLAQGNQIYPVGDVNGDGYDDFQINFTGDDTISIYYGSANGPLPNPDVLTMVDDPKSGTNYTASTGVGDYNNDGYDDFLFIDFYYDTDIGHPNYYRHGKAWLHLGTPSGIAITPTMQIVGRYNLGLLGHEANGVGDINGDGFDDFALMERNNPGYQDNFIRVYYGHSNVPSSANPDWSWAIGRNSIQISLAGADVNGDGYSDLIMGEQNYSNGENAEGRIVAFHGSSTSLPSTPDWQLESNMEGYLLGHSVVPIGDVNNDGYEDIMHGTREIIDPLAAKVILGSAAGLEAEPVWTFTRQPDLINYGNDILRGIGDVNGDGSPDIAVGFPFYDDVEPMGGSEYAHGKVWVFYSQYGVQSPTISVSDRFTVTEGSTVLLTAVGSDPNGETLSYEWDLNADGLFETPTQTVTFSAINADGPDSQAVTVRVTNESSVSATAQSNVTILNATPIVDAGENVTGDTNTPIQLIGSFTDAGTQDSHLIKWDFGDGLTSTGTLTPAHTFLSSGTYSVTLTVTDDDGAAGNDSVFVTVEDPTPTVCLYQSDGTTGLAGGVVTYYDAGWQSFGTTGVDGCVSNTAVSFNTYQFRMAYGGTTNNITQNLGVDPVVTFQTTLVTVQLQDSSGNPLDTGTVSYYASGWKSIGDTISGTVAIELLPQNYQFRMAYGGSTNNITQNVGVDPMVTFQTTHVTVQLQDSSGNPLDTGTVSYYASGWKSIGDTISGTVSIELLPQNYQFRMAYGGTTNNITQNVGVDPMVTFQTTHVTVQLQDSSGDPLDTGTVTYYASGWKSIGDTISGTVSIELLPQNYQFRMAYGGSTNNITQNVGVDPMVTFQTTHVTVQLQNSSGDHLDTGTVSYYASGWKSIGDTISGTVSIELLPQNYQFRMAYGGTTSNLTQNVGADPVVTFQTTNVTVQLQDNNGDPLDTGTASYYASGWKPIGDTISGTVSIELLPRSYQFRMVYGGITSSITQNVGVDPIVIFQIN